MAEIDRGSSRRLAVKRIVRSPELLLPAIGLVASVVLSAGWIGFAAAGGDLPAVGLRFSIGVAAGFYYFSVFHYALGKLANADQ